jgi:serine protease Do
MGKLLAVFPLFTLLVSLNIQSANNQLPSFSELVEVSSPAVVNISSSKTVKSRGYGSRGFNNDPFYDDFFKRFFGEPPRQGQGQREREREVRSGGSGFIISKDGYLLTNNHVVDDADEIIVSLSDRREYKAELIGSDERSDLALLKIEAENLPVVKIGKSNDLKVGEWVVAIGSPFQLNFSVTAGIVSAKGRSIPNGSDSTYVPFIQTDVAINPGNSGGPLFNLEGKVVGINSQIYTRSGGYMGVSFAIPIDYAMDIVNQLKEGGSVARGWLGVSIQEVTSDFAKSLGMSVPKGALVSQVMPDSPAEKAGLLVRDVIVEFDGVEIVYSGDLPQTVGSIKPGSKIEANIIREGKAKKIKIEVGKLPDNLSLASSSQGNKSRDLGVVVRELTFEERREMKLGHGVLITEVNPEGLAAQQGILKGDIITYLLNQKIRNSRDLSSALEKAKENSDVAMIGLVRGGVQTFRSLKLTK